MYVDYYPENVTIFWTIMQR